MIRALFTTILTWLAAVSAWAGIAFVQVFGTTQLEAFDLLWAALGPVFVSYYWLTCIHRKPSLWPARLFGGISFFMFVPLAIAGMALNSFAFAPVMGVAYLIMLAHVLRLGWLWMTVGIAGGIAAAVQGMNGPDFDLLYGSQSVGLYWFWAALIWQATAGILCLAAICKGKLPPRNAITEACHKCGYALKGISVARCPECGNFLYP